MSKRRKYTFNKGLGRPLFLAVFFLVLQEILLIVYPMILKNTTDLIKNNQGTLPTTSVLLTNAGLVVLFLVIIFFVSLYGNYRLNIYSSKTRANARKLLYEKMTRIPTDKLNHFGTGKALAIMTNDTQLVKYKSTQYTKACIYFLISILGSLIMVATLSPIYLLILLTAIPVELLIIYIYRRINNKVMPSAVVAYDKSFATTRESIAGARDIRILGKLGERTKESAKQNNILLKEGIYIDESKHTFSCINNLIFGIITFMIIMYGASSVENAKIAEQLVILSTVIQYITIVTTACNDIFTLIINPMTRGKIAYERIDEFMNLPEEDMDSGTKNISMDFGSTLVLHQIGHKFWNGRRTISKLSMEVSKGKMIALFGEAGSGKTTFVKILLKYIDPTEGEVLVNGVNIKEINKRYLRSKIISYCPTYPDFVPGTVRQNIKVFNPNLTDEEILAAFNEIGATNLAIVPSFLDSQISVRSKLPQNIKNIINLVRCILKPAEFYIFDRSFSHVSKDIVENTLKKLRAENKACIFTTFNNKVCKEVDEVYFAKNDHTFVKGSHDELFLTNKDYANFFNQTELLEDKI